MASTVLPENLVLKLDLPDPDQDNLSGIEFLNRLENAWTLCEKFDLQTEICRGTILRAIRDKEKKGGDGRGTGFLQWLREMEISKTRAYNLIQLAESADDLVGGGMLNESSVNKFSRKAFIETAQSLPEVQQLISEAANEGQEITRRQVKRLSDEFTSVTSPLLPEEIRERTQANLLPPKVVAPFVKELSKLPEMQQEGFKEALKEKPDVDCIKDLTSSARWIGKSIEASLSLRSLEDKDLNLEKATQEAQRLDSLGLLADALGQAKAVEASVLKLYLSWKRLAGLQERLWVESGSSTPYLRDVLNALQSLSGHTMKLSLGEISGGKKLRLQIVEENFDQLSPPRIN